MLIMKTVSFEELSNGMSIQEVVSLKNERLWASMDGLREHDPVLYAEVEDSDLFTSDPAVLKSLLARCKDEVAYSSDRGQRFHSDGGHHSALMADSFSHTLGPLPSMS